VYGLITEYLAVAAILVGGGPDPHFLAVGCPPVIGPPLFTAMLLKYKSLWPAMLLLNNKVKVFAFYFVKVASECTILTQNLQKIFWEGQLPISRHNPLNALSAPRSSHTRHSPPGPWDPPHFRLTTVGSRAFPVAASRIWNDLPADVTSSPSLSIFRRRLKTVLFKLSHNID